ncbi:thiamine pyrophosphokinase [Paenibacillus sp. J31TS4]|uniref:thiamine diphosphokinase n=1 Tax=Paenibacillus sp. J31TS4 TaxID=2807195 RepID=UPI001B0A964A|nr:thiamine diphosphokinase [Paenibacillus sp. J31TS4]GIP40022.1 thiamine pyrophosphokinase [Paenibacillus sp. J31TS4]
MNERQQRIVIFSGGRLGEWALGLLGGGALAVGADRGALFLVRHGVRPDLAVGDFDSVSPEEQEQIRQASREFRSCDPVDKDYTDTELAFRWALEQRPDELILTGVLGSRVDHSLANIQLLALALAAGVRCSIVDDRNRLRLTDGELEMARSAYAHVSLLPLGAPVTGVTLEGFRYPLREATLALGQSLGISNVLEAERGRIRIRSGLLLVIESGDEPSSV